MKRVLILNGVARCGKDTFAEAILDRAVDMGNTIPYTLSTVDLVKDMLVLAGIDRRAKPNKDRKLMSDLKDLLTAHSNIPFNDIANKIKKWENDAPQTIFMVMCREPEEIQKFKDFYGDECLTIIITRPDIETPDNHADQNVGQFNYEVEVSNSGSISDLEAIAYHICDTLFEE